MFRDKNLTPVEEENGKFGFCNIIVIHKDLIMFILGKNFKLNFKSITEKYYEAPISHIFSKILHNIE
jgi:hypothetical protein